MYFLKRVWFFVVFDSLIIQVWGGIWCVLVSWRTKFYRALLQIGLATRIKFFWAVKKIQIPQQLKLVHQQGNVSGTVGILVIGGIDEGALLKKISNARKLLPSHALACCIAICEVNQKKGGSWGTWKRNWVRMKMGSKVRTGYGSWRKKGSWRSNKRYEKLKPGDEKNFRGMVEDLERILKQLWNMDEDINRPQVEIMTETKLLEWAVLEMLKMKEAGGMDKLKKPTGKDDKTSGRC